jgi:hypothetical protein
MEACLRDYIIRYFPLTPQVASVTLEAVRGFAFAAMENVEVRKPPSWPRSWANFSLS